MRALLAFATIVAALAVTAHARQSDELVIGITQYPSTLHPNIDSMLAKTYVLAMVQRPFTVHDEDWTLQCLLCVSLPSLENGGAKLESLADGRRGVAVTYEIQPDARWGDGQPVSTRDVVFTWRIGRHPKSGVAAQELYRRILDIQVHGEKSFTLHQDRVTFDYAALGGFRLVPEHLERQPFERDPGQYRQRTLYEVNPTEPGLYFGPYRITETVRGSHVVLERNPTWYGKEPYFRRIVVRAIENTAALEANLLSGEIDYVAGELGLSLDQALAFDKRHGDRFRVVYKPGLVYEHIDLNLANPVLSDLRVRAALAHAIDRRAISEQLFAGKQPVAHSSVNPLDWIYDDSVPKLQYDPDKAEHLLRDAGWTKSPSGLLQGEDGQPLTIEFMTTAGNRSRELVQQVLQSQWRALGVDVRVRNEPARVFFGQTLTQRRFSGLAMYAWISAPESVPRTVLHSNEIPNSDNGWSGQNYMGYRNPEMDELLDAIELELDRDRRRLLWSRLQALYARDLPVIPLYFRANAYVTPKWLRGIVPTGHLDPSSLWVERWYRND